MSPAAAPRCAAWHRQVRLLLRHARFGWRGPAARSRELATLFRGVNAWLRSSGADHWLAYGTLLGWHRSGALLPHDTDVDFGTTVASYELLRHAGSRLPPGFVLRDSSPRHHGPKLYVTHRGWEADIYFYVAHAGLLRSTERTLNPGDARPFPRDWVLPLQPSTLLGEPVFVPARTPDLLRHHYGYIGPDAVRDPVTRYFRPRHPAPPAPVTTSPPR